MKFKYFNYSEFDSPDLKGSGSKMSDEVISMLDVARKKYGKAMVINSGYRTCEHNAEVGGKPESSHLKGLAVDISCVNSTDRFNLEGVLRDVGFKRLGIGKTFIHADIDKNKSQCVTWLY
jgi:uncharacterized protein YcbK (DUF882 family)|tara:strand:- start:343 stop:702 length:360 start_codon:yes stop_codon:yes gene_type:complete